MPVRYRYAIAAIAILAATVPAQADWETTQWGMSPDAALAVLDGARSHDPAPSEIYEMAGIGYAPLVILPYEIDGVAGQISLLFDAGESLSFVLFAPDDLADCEALGAALTDQHGAADLLSTGAISISDWLADGDAIKLTHVQGAVCNLSYAPA